MKQSAWSVGSFILAATIGICSSVWPDKIKPHPYAVTIFAVFGILCLLLPMAQTAWLHHRQTKSPLEINFDPNNPARRHWSVETIEDTNGKPHPFWEHRVEIKNNSMKTLRNVSVTIERIGPMPERPYDSLFDKLNKTACDIKPGCSELVPVIRWPYNKAQAGNLAGPSAFAYGPVKITASADDTLPAIKIFDFDYQTDQMLFERRES